MRFGSCVVTPRADAHVLHSAVFAEFSVFGPSCEHQVIELIAFLILFTAHAEKRALCWFFFTCYADCVSGSVTILFPKLQLVLVEVSALFNFLTAYTQKLWFICLTSLADCVSGSVPVLFLQPQLLLVEVMALFNFLAAHTIQKLSFTSHADCVSGSVPMLYPKRELVLVEVIAPFVL